MNNILIGKAKTLVMTIVKAWFSRFLIVLSFGFGAIVLLALVAPKVSADSSVDECKTILDLTRSKDMAASNLITATYDTGFCVAKDSNSWTVSFIDITPDYLGFSTSGWLFSNYPIGSYNLVRYDIIRNGDGYRVNARRGPETVRGASSYVNNSLYINYIFPAFNIENFPANYSGYPQPFYVDVDVKVGDYLLAEAPVDNPDYYYINCVNDQINFGCKVGLTIGEELRSAKFSKPYLFALQYHHNGDELYYVCPNYFSSFTEYSVVDVNVDTWDCIMQGYQVQAGYGMDCKVLEYRDRIVQTEGQPVSIPSSPKLVTVSEENLDRWLDPREDYNVLYLYQITKAIQKDYSDFEDDELLTQNLVLVLIDYNDYKADGTLTPLVYKEINYQGIVDTVVPPPDGSSDLTDTDSPVYKPRPYDVENFDKLTHLDSPEFEFTIPDFDSAPVNFFSWLWSTITDSPLGIILISCLSFIIVGIIIRGT